SDLGMIQTTQNFHRFGFMRAVGYIDKNRFGPEEGADHRPESWQNTFETARETNRLAPRPREPGPLMEFPFRRHAVAEFSRCRIQIHVTEKGTALTETSTDQTACEARRFLREPRHMQIHVARDGHRMGPFSLEEVNRQLAAGSLGLSDLAWYEGIPNWIALSQLPGVAAAATIPGAAVPVMSASETIAPDSSYGGFWIRVAAYILDAIILGIPLAILNVALNPKPNDPSSSHPVLAFVLTFLIELAYFAGFWSSGLQATLGQKICGLRVVSASDFGKISFVRAAGRFFAMI